MLTRTRPAKKLQPGQIPQAYDPIGEYQRSFTMLENWASCYLRLNGATMTDLRDWLKAHNIVTLYKTQNRLTKKLLHFSD